MNDKLYTEFVILHTKPTKLTPAKRALLQCALSGSGTHCGHTFRAYLSLKLSFNTDYTAQNTVTMEDEISSSQLFPLEDVDMSELLSNDEWNSFEFSEFRPLTQSSDFEEEKVRKR